MKLLSTSLVTALSSTYKLIAAKSPTGISCWQLVSCDIFYLCSLDFSCEVLKSFYGFLAVPDRSSLSCMTGFIMIPMSWLLCQPRNWNGPLLRTTATFLNLSDFIILFLCQFAAVDISQGKVWNVFSLMVQFSNCFFLTHYICIRDNFWSTVLLLSFMKISKAMWETSANINAQT